MVDLTKIAERLKELMIEKSVKPAMLANELNVDESTIRRWLRAENAAFRNQLINLALYFNCPIDYIVGRIDDYNEFKPKKCPVFIVNLRQIMKEKEITSYKLDKETSIKLTYLSRWKRGVEPHLYSLVELANYLDCSIDYLVGLEN